MTLLANHYLTEISFCFFYKAKRRGKVSNPTLHRNYSVHHHNAVITYQEEAIKQEDEDTRTIHNRKPERSQQSQHTPDTYRRSIATVKCHKPEEQIQQPTEESLQKSPLQQTHALC